MSNYIGALALVCLAASADAVKINKGENDGKPKPKLGPKVESKVDFFTRKPKKRPSKRTFDKKEKTAATP